MNLFPITTPQMGEGLTEVRLVRRFKALGDAVKRDEALCELETDKAVFPVESPVEGELREWKVAEDQVLLIGEILCLIATAADLESAEDSGQELPQPSEAPRQRTSNELRNHRISPRVRAYCVQRGLSIAEIQTLLSDFSKERITAADVDFWIESRQSESCVEVPLSARQQQLAQRLVRAWSAAVPASMQMECRWNPLERTIDALRHHEQEKLTVSGLQLVAWCVLQALEHHPKFRSTWVNGTVLRQSNQASVGVAVALPEDELSVAVVPGSSTKDFRGFSAALRQSIVSARAGETVAQAPHVIISDLSRQGVHSAVPVNVPPAAGTLFLGAPREVPRRGDNDSFVWEHVVSLTLTFDHRFINGVGAADFLREICLRIEMISHNNL